MDKIKKFLNIHSIEVSPVINDAMFDNQKIYMELLDRILKS